MPPDLDALLTALYVYVDDSLPARCGSGRPPATSDSELICLAVAQILLDSRSDRHFLAVAGVRLAHLFPVRPKHSVACRPTALTDHASPSRERRSHPRSRSR